MEVTCGIIRSAQKICVYGPEGIGKSGFASHFPNPIFEDTEGSTKHMDVARTPKSSSWAMIGEHIKYLKANPMKCDTYVLDTADWAERLCKVGICANGQKTSLSSFAHGTGYVLLMEEFGRLLNSLEDLVDLGINIVILAHATMRKFEQPDELGSYDRWEMKLEKKVYPLVKEWADMVLFANFKTYVVNVDNQGATKGKNKAQGGKRVMYTTHHSCWDAKNRHDLREELPFDFNEIAHCIPVRGGASRTKSAVAETPKDFQQIIQTTLPENTKLDASDIVYWHHPESCCVFTEAPGVIPSNDGLCMQIEKEEYETLKPKYDQSEKSANEQPKQDPPKEETPTKIEQAQNDLSGVPKPLADLMAANNVTVKDIQQVVASRGYYPESTPIANYDPDFVSGVLVGAWTQVFEMIKAFKDDIPF